jgi:arginine utilization protein RocB
MTTATAAVTTDTTATPVKRARKVTWVIRLAKRLERAKNEVEQVQQEFERIEQKVAEKNSVDKPKFLSDIAETTAWIAGLAKDLESLPRSFFPLSRKRTLTVFQPGEKLVLRDTAPATYAAFAGQEFEVLAVDKQSVSWRTNTGASGVGMVSHFRRPTDPPKVKPAGTGAKAGRRTRSKSA